MRKTGTTGKKQQDFLNNIEEHDREIVIKLEESKSVKNTIIYYSMQTEEEYPKIKWQNSGICNGNYAITFKIKEYPCKTVRIDLRDVLEKDVQEKYFLSPKACAGVLFRTEKRGNSIPHHLIEAFRQTVSYLKKSEEKETNS